MRDPLSPARGVINGLALAVIVWAVAAVTVMMIIVV